jgi:hypothetical protein
MALFVLRCRYRRFWKPRSTTAGGTGGSANASVTQLNGLWVNNAAIASGNCYNGTTSYAVSQNQGTLLGSFYTSAAGQTALKCQPASAAGGSASIVGFGNVYNRVPITCTETNSSPGWTYATNAFRYFDNNVHNSVSWVDPLQQYHVEATAVEVASTNTAGNVPYIGIGVNSTSAATGNGYGFRSAATATVADNYGELIAKTGIYPLLGFNYVAGLEACSSFTCTYSLNFGDTYVVYSSVY